MTNTSDTRSLGELFASLSKDTTTLVRQEIELAKTEISEKVSETGKNVASLMVGGAIAYAALYSFWLPLRLDSLKSWSRGWQYSSWVWSLPLWGSFWYKRV